MELGSVLDSSGSDDRADSVERLTKQAAKGGGIAFFGLVGGQAIGILLNMLLTRVLGASAYGLYALGQSVLNFNRQISALGLHQGVVRFGARDAGERKLSRLKGTILSSLLISGCLGVCMGALVYGLAEVIAVRFFKEPGLVPVLRVFAFAFPFYTFMVVAGSAARALRRVDIDVGVQRVLLPVLNLIIVTIFFLMGIHILGAVYGFLISLVLAAAVGFYLLAQVFPELLTNLIPTYNLKPLLSYSVVLLFIGLANQLTNQVDRFALGYFETSEKVGIYSAAALVAAKTSIVWGALGLIFSPIIADLYNRGLKLQLESLFKTVTRWSLTLTMPVFLVFVFFSRDILKIFGTEFVGGTVVLTVLTGAQFVKASVGRVDALLIMTGYQKIELINGLVSGILMVSLNVLLVPGHGIIGAAMSVGLTIIFISLCRLGEIYYLFRIHPYRLSYWKSAAAVVPSILFGIGSRAVLPSVSWLWVLKAALMVSIFFAFLALLGFDPEDKIVLLALRKRFIGKR